MQSNFALEDPEIFNHVLPWNMVTQETKGGMREAPRNSAKLLQEKVWIMNLCMFLSHEPGVGKMLTGKLNRRQYCQFIFETKICFQCWQSMKLWNSVIIPVCHCSDEVIPDIPYRLEGPYPFFFLRLRWLRLTVNRGLALAMINPQLTPIICSVCQGPLLMRLFNLHLPSAAVTLPWYHRSKPCASNLTQIRRLFQCHGITRSASRSRGPDNQWD